MQDAGCRDMTTNDFPCPQHPVSRILEVVRIIFNENTQLTLIEFLHD
jgi:hypothetical protein